MLIPLLVQCDENLDAGTPVFYDYEVPFRFTGKLDKLTLAIGRPKLSQGDVKMPMAAAMTGPTSI